jgi:RimJ/RimL family protein N-acetyltransferase
MVIYENDEIYVRSLDYGDINEDAYQQWFFDQEVCKYNSHGKMSHGFNTHKLLDNDDNRIVWAVFKKGNTDELAEFENKDTHIGNVCLQEIDWINRNAEFTCIFGEKEYWGKGYCTQAMKWLFSHGFKKLGIDKIYLGTASGNEGMKAAATKIGMHKEGYLRDHLYLNGCFWNVVQMAVFKRDWHE